MPASRPRRDQRRARRSRERTAAIVLIVDDTADVRELYSEYLTARGFRVATASDGDSGIAAALRYHPDVIVMDLAMPWVDGITATRRLKADPRTRKVPVIVLTGYAYRAIDQGALEAGAAAFLTKPCLPEDLETQILRVAGRSSAAA